MDPRMTRDLLRRLGDLERGQVRYRQGTVSDDSPLSVKLGGSDTAYTDVAALGGQPFEVNDVVSVITFGNDLLVLGLVGDGALKVPQARVTSTGNQAITTATATALTFDTERWDSGTTSEQHSNSTNNSRLTCQLPGLYHIAAHAEFASNATGLRNLYVLQNGTSRLVDHTVPAVNGAATRMAVSTQVRLAASDYVQAYVYQDSGGNLNVVKQADYSPELMWHWVSP